VALVVLVVAVLDQQALRENLGFRVLQVQAVAAVVVVMEEFLLEQVVQA
jgi:hypothetical protein